MVLKSGIKPPMRTNIHPLKQNGHNFTFGILRGSFYTSILRFVQAFDLCIGTQMNSTVYFKKKKREKKEEITSSKEIICLN